MEAGALPRALWRISASTPESERSWYLTLVRDRGTLALMKRLVLQARAPNGFAPASCAILPTSRSRSFPISISCAARDDLDPAMPPFLVAYLEWVWR